MCFEAKPTNTYMFGKWSAVLTYRFCFFLCLSVFLPLFPVFLVSLASRRSLRSPRLSLGVVGVSPAPCTYVNKYEGTYLWYKSYDSSIISQIAKRLCDRISSYLKSNVAEEKIPDQIIKSLARLFLPDILEFYSTKDSTQPEQQKREQDTKTLLPKD